MNPETNTISLGYGSANSGDLQLQEDVWIAERVERVPRQQLQAQQQEAFQRQWKD